MRFILAAALSLVATCSVAFAQPFDGTRFAAELTAFEQQDAAAPTVPGAVVFTGSSTIRLWSTLEQDMAPLRVVNRGFGGSRLSDVLANFDLLVTRQRPAAIVLYCGDNDVAAGRTPEQILIDVKQFLSMKEARLGAVPVFFVSIKPSPARAEQLLIQQEANRRVKALAATRRDLHFVDVTKAMTSRTVRMRADLFGPDGLHMSSGGYAVWTSILRGALGRWFAEDGRVE